MTKAILFDGGGTIWDSMKILFDSYKWAFEQLGLCNKEDFPFTLEECNRLCSLESFNTEAGKARGFVALFLTKTNIKNILNAENPNKILIGLVKEAENKYKDFSCLSEKLGKLLTKYLYEIFDDTKYPLCKNVKQVLKTLKNKGLMLAMVSNRKRESTLKILRSHNIDNIFDYIITWEDQTKPKPSPEGIEKVMQKLADYKILKDSGADIIISDISELLKLI